MLMAALKGLYFHFVERLRLSGQWFTKTGSHYVYTEFGAIF